MTSGNDSSARIGTEFVLPFAVIEREGGAAEEFPMEMTLATVLADVENQREKAGFLRRREEAMEFATLVYWPIIVAPWRQGRHLVFDGMGVWSHVFPHGRIPDAPSCAAKVEAAGDHESLRTLLQGRQKYFDAFADTLRVPIMGLFIHEEFMQDVLAHLALGRPEQLEAAPALTPRLTPEQVGESVTRMRALVDAFRRDLDTLTATSKSLERALDRTRNELAKLREETKRSYGRKVDALHPDVAARVAMLEREREERWATMQPKLLDLQAQVRKAEADFAHWDTMSRRKDNPTEAARAKERKAAAGLEWERAKGYAQAFQNEMAKARASYDRQVQEQWERIRSLEREREAEVARLAQEEKSVAALVSKLSNAVAGLSKRLEDGIRFLESQGVPAAVKDTTMVHMPIMVASLMADRRRRIIVYPPMVARTGRGVFGALKVTFGGAVLPLEPKTEQFEEIFRGGIEKALAEDVSLSAYLASVGNANNLLHQRDLRRMLSRGLGELRGQGWIKSRHERQLLGSVERHIKAAARTAPRGRT